MRLDIDRQHALEPQRLQYAKQKIEQAGYKITLETETQLQFEFEGHKVYFFPYSGWHSGASIKDGRGINELLRQIK